MTLPAQWAWLAAEASPILKAAIPLYGTLEGPGDSNNPTILSWAAEMGVGSLYNADSIPWCGLFAGVVCKRAGESLPNHLLWALSWASFGSVVANAEAGLADILVFTRSMGGHVGFYVGEDADCFYSLGGNQSDSVSIARIAKARLYAVRRGRLEGPARKVTVGGAGGIISTNEA